MDIETRKQIVIGIDQQIQRWESFVHAAEREVKSLQEERRKVVESLIYIRPSFATVPNELAYWEARRNKELDKFVGQYVVMSAGKLLGPFATEQEADTVADGLDLREALVFHVGHEHDVVVCIG